jgi:hypothetical protein
MQGTFNFIFDDFVFIQVTGRCMMEYFLSGKNSYVLSVAKNRTGRVSVKKEFALLKNLKKGSVEVVLTSEKDPSLTFVFDSKILDRELGVEPCPSVTKPWTLVFE